MKVKIVKKPKVYELPNELWSIVKDYAGVYHITTNWDKVMNVGVQKLHDYFKENFNCRITNYRKRPDQTKEMILKSIINRGMNKKKWDELAKLVDKKRKMKESGIDLSQYKVGEEVYYIGSDYDYVGIITKINKASITFKPYTISHIVSSNPNASYMQTIETIKYYYDKSNYNKPKSVRTGIWNRQMLEATMPYNLDKFNYRCEYIDYAR